MLVFVVARKTYSTVQTVANKNKHNKEEAIRRKRLYKIKKSGKNLNLARVTSRYFECVTRYLRDKFLEASKVYACHDSRAFPAASAH